MPPSSQEHSKLLNDGTVVSVRGSVVDVRFVHCLPPIRTLLRACLLPSAQRRVDDAWHVFEDFHEILGRLYGPPQFRQFQMPRDTVTR